MLLTGPQLSAKLDALARQIEQEREASVTEEEAYLRAEAEFKKAEAEALLQQEGTVQEREAKAIIHLWRSGAMEAWLPAKAKYQGRKGRIDLLKAESSIQQSRLRDERDTAP